MNFDLLRMGFFECLGIVRIPVMYMIAYMGFLFDNKNGSANHLLSCAASPLIFESDCLILYVASLQSIYVRQVVILIILYYKCKFFIKNIFSLNNLPMLNRCNSFFYVVLNHILLNLLQGC